MSHALTVIDGDSSQYAGKTPGGAGLAHRQFRMFLEDCRWQPAWRNMADKCVDYYDGNQLDQDTLLALERKGMGPLIRNITAPLINVVLGMEAKTRTDWRCVADTDELQEVAEALSAALHESERESRADRACSDAYAGQVKAGLGWVEVSRNADPFQYPYRCQYVHRREIWWDWRDESPDLHKARYLIRKRWFDIDQAVAFFPEHAELLQATVGDPNRYDLIVSKRALDLGMDLEESRGLDIEDIEEWRSFDRHRICLYEVWYRIFVRGFVAKLPNGEVVEVDTRNPVHLALLNRGAMRAERAVYSKLRSSIWAGPHRLVDLAYPKRQLPYVPFWGYREDRTGVPYGLIRAMISPQDEVNARLQKMMWLLGAKRVMMDSDALNQELQTPADMLAELARPDAVIFMNPSRTNRQNAMLVEDNLQLADAQFKVLQDAMMSSQQVVGIFNAMLGRDSSTTANSALQTLVDQGTTALAEINDNQRFARRTVGERLLDLRRDDMAGQQVDIAAGEQGRRRVITLNKPIERIDPQTQKAQVVIQNNTAVVKVRVALDDIPSAPAYREQQFTMLAELTKGLPPQLQAVIAPFIIEASDLQKRRDIADTLRKAMGQPIPKTPEEEKAAEAAQAEQAAFMADIQRKTMLAELEERQAKATELRAKAVKAMAEAKADPNAGVAAGQQAEFEKRVQDIQAQAEADIDRLTAERMTLQINAARRETMLLNKLSETVIALKQAAGDKKLEEKKADIELQVAQIEKERDIEVARINADAQKVVDGLVDQINKVKDDLSKQVDSVKADAEKRDQEAKVERERRKIEKQKEKAEEDKRRADDERKRSEETAKRDKEQAAQREKDQKESKGKAEAAPTPTVVVVGDKANEAISKMGADMVKGLQEVVAEIKKPKPATTKRARVKGPSGKTYDIEIGGEATPTKGKK